MAGGRHTASGTCDREAEGAQWNKQRSGDLTKPCHPLLNTSHEEKRQKRQGLGPGGVSTRGRVLSLHVSLMPRTLSCSWHPSLGS